MTPIVVFVHVHYLETWPDLSRRIEDTVRSPFRLFVTTTRRADEIVPPTSAYMVDFTVLETANRGRDVLPFLRAVEQAGAFDVGLKLHGKRSVHRLDGEAWRDALVGSLLTSADAVCGVVERFAQDRRIGLVAPHASLCSISRHVGGNSAPMASVAERTGTDLAGMLARTPFFCAGTMFWFRRAALERVAGAGLADLFANEEGQTDGTVAHAMERLFAAFVEAENFLAVPMEVATTTDANTDREAIRVATLQCVDIDQTYVRLPGPMAAFVMRHLRFAVPAYLALPTPMRRAVKAIAGGAVRLARR